MASSSSATSTPLWTTLRSHARLGRAHSSRERGCAGRLATTRRVVWLAMAGDDGPTATYAKRRSAHQCAHRAAARTLSQADDAATHRRHAAHDHGVLSAVPPCDRGRLRAISSVPDELSMNGSNACIGSPVCLCPLSPTSAIGNWRNAYAAQDAFGSLQSAHAPRAGGQLCPQSAHYAHAPA